MKNRIKISAMASMMLFSAAAYSQSDSLGMPGDNLDLDAVLSIFKQSSNVEDFEKRLNSAEPKINNLDLNNDGKVDYLRVVDYGKDNFHSLVIQDPVSKTESQDVAVIEVVKKDDQTIHLQIVGDETMYGKNYIIEPSDGTQAKTTTAKNDRGYEDDVYNNNTDQDIAGSQVMVNVYAWPTVGYLYSPGYSYWSSPWYWGYYPGWYSPWSPYGGWYSYHRSFYGGGWGYGWYGYRTNYHAFPRAHNYYYGHRSSSGYVQKNVTYGRRGNGTYNGGNRMNGQQRANSSNPRVSNNRNGGSGNISRSPDTRVRNNGGTSPQNQNRVSQGNPTRVQGGGGRVQSSPSTNRGGMSGGGRVNGGGGGGRVGGGSMGGGGGSRGGGGGGGGRVSGGGGGGGRR